MTDRDTLSAFVKKLELWGPLSSEDQQAVLALPYTVAQLPPGKQIKRHGDKPLGAYVLLGGFAFRYKVLLDGCRSISGIHMKGDVVDLQNVLFGTADHGLQTLTLCDVAFIPREALLRLIFTNTNIGSAIWYDSFVEAAISREWIANLGRRDALARLSHLMCEFGVRFQAIGLGDRESYELPMTQEQLADATGLTQVHVNRMLKELEKRGFITRGQKSIRVANWEALAAEGGFSDTYLHLQDDRHAISSQ